MFWIIVLLAVLFITFYHLRGEDLSRYDWPPGQSFGTGEGPSEQHRALEAFMREAFGGMMGGSGSESASGGSRGRIARLRQVLDGLSDSQQIDATITRTHAGGVPAEWVLAPGADPARRVLYIHGGGFIVGSPKSHRNITSNFSRVAGAAVLAIDYRLLPEDSRKDGIEDCRRAYSWLINNGPDGPAAADRVFVGGDSAGGNLTLSLTAWLRGKPLRQPDAAVALSPLTDGTMASPSLLGNLKTDAMLGPALGRITRVPRPLLWWGSWLWMRINPSDPVVSPVYGDLSGLPPTLVHASEAEMLLDDARRYVNRAAAAGSPVRLQTWPHVMHVWHIFHPDLDEARAAWDEIGAFIADTDAAGTR
ncbi:MAG: alpha/beta hydrolase [Halioglobus sp.]|nr:alpha/beta hydrolase [Halioglobus sp.]